MNTTNKWANPYKLPVDDIIYNDLMGPINPSVNRGDNENIFLPEEWDRYKVLPNK